MPSGGSRRVALGFVRESLLALALVGCRSHETGATNAHPANANVAPDPGDTDRRYWLAADPLTHQPVLLHTDAPSRSDYRVAESWSPRVQTGDDVPRASWTQCYLGDVSHLPLRSASLEAIEMSVNDNGAVTLMLGFDLTLPGPPFRYHCGAAGPVWSSLE